MLRLMNCNSKGVFTSYRRNLSIVPAESCAKSQVLSAKNRKRVGSIRKTKAISSGQLQADWMIVFSLVSHFHSYVFLPYFFFLFFYLFHFLLENHWFKYSFPEFNCQLKEGWKRSLDTGRTTPWNIFPSILSIDFLLLFLLLFFFLLFISV